MLLLLDLGTEDGPSVRTKLCSTLTTVAFLQANLKLGVCVLMDVHGLRGWMGFREIWVSLVSCNSDET